MSTKVLAPTMAALDARLDTHITTLQLEGMPKLPQPSPPSPTHSEVSFSTARRQSTYSTLSNGTDETESTSIGTPGLGLGDSGIMCGPPWILQDSEGHELESEYHQEGEEHQAWCSAKTEESEYSFPKYTSTSDFTRGTSPSFSGSVSGLSAAAGRLTGSSRASARTGGGKVLHGHSPALVESVTELVLRVEEWRLGLSSGPTQLKRNKAYVGLWALGVQELMANSVLVTAVSSPAVSHHSFPRR